MRVKLVQDTVWWLVWCQVIKHQEQNIHIIGELKIYLMMFPLSSPFVHCTFVKFSMHSHSAVFLYNVL